MRKKLGEDLILSGSLIMFIVGAIGLISTTTGFKITGMATSGTTISNVTIQAYFSISLSGNLSEGISFGTITQLPSVDVNATKNFNSTVNPNWGNETLYWITVSNDSNTVVDFCVAASKMNTSGGDEIGLGNYTWNDSVNNNMNEPSILPGNQTAMSEYPTYTAGVQDVPIGGNVYYRFLLDIPSGQPTGTYNNTIYFKGKSSGAC